MLILINDSNNIAFSTRENKSSNLTEYYNLIYEYKNDCLTAALKFKKTFLNFKNCSKFCQISNLPSFEYIF